MKRSMRQERRHFSANMGWMVERCESRQVLSTLPTGFTENTVVSGLNQPTAMELAPDGRVFVTEQTGALRVIKDGSLLSTPFATFDVDSFFERGLLGVTFDPDFDTNQFVYVYYTVNGTTKHNRVSRLTANGDVMVPGSELILLELNTLNAGNHNGGAIHFGDDGKFYIATGDNALGANAQSFTNLLGKILRINSDGTIPADNPFYATATGDNRAIWAYGLRNPFTFAFDPSSARMLINDVGQNTWEEIDDGIVGSNYGWPASEGPTSNPNFRAPLFAYSHSDPDPNQGGTAITGGAFYSPQTVTFPAEYVGDYFFADYGNNWIRRLELSDNSVSGFATDVDQAIVDLKVTPEGDLLVLQYDFGATGTLTRISANTQPVVTPEISQHPADASTSIGGTVEFSVTATGTAPLAYQWQKNEVDIPDATSSTLTLINVQAEDDGAQFRCVVTNAGGTDTSNTATLTVTSNHVPVPTITLPTSGTRYRAGDVLNFSGSAADPDEGALSSSSLSWRIDFHHATHSHPFYPETSEISSGQVTIPTTGETATNVFYRITLTATDSTGATASVTRDITPLLVSQTLDANVPGATLTLDDQPLAAGRTFASVVGMTRSIGTTPTQTISGQAYEFVRWSDGGAASHTTTAPGRTNTLVAIFRRVADTAPVTATFSVDNGTLTVTSTFASTIIIGEQSGKVFVRNQNVDVTSLGDVSASQVKRLVLIGGSDAERFDLTGINVTKFPALSHVIADLGAGDDLVNGVVTWSGSNSLLGGAGRDTLVGGNGADFLMGDNDQDYLYGAGGLDTLRGGDGDDTLRGGGGNDILEGGAGSDLLLEIGDANFILSATAMTGRDNDPINSMERAQITGGSSGNLLDAASFGGRVTLFGAAGNDTLFGGSGNDLLRGDEDSTNGSGGNDTIFAGGGSDTISGGGGDDNLNGQNGNDSILGDAGNDVLVGGAGLDTILGGAGNDFLSGQTDAGLLFGGDGNDILQGNTANDTLNGDAGDDRLYGLQGNDVINGGDGDDSLLGAIGNDSLRGDAGTDTLQGDVGNDTLDGGADFDRINEVLDTNLTIVGITVTTTGLGADSVLAMERIQVSGGTSHNFFDARQSSVPVFLSGGTGNDTLLGGSNADGISGGEGDDVLSGGAGADVIDGGAGIDYLFENADTDFTINGVAITSSITGTDMPTAVERIALIGGVGANKLDATQATVAVVLIGGRGNDTLLGGAASDTLSGGNRNDATVAGGDGADSLDGGAAADVLENDSADTVVLGAGDTTTADVFTLLPSWIDAL